MMLRALLREYPGQLAADFPRFYGMALSEARYRVTLWEFASMAVNLPRESATWAAIHGAQTREWDLKAQLLAEIANSTRWLQWAQTKDGAKNRNRPELILPPWVEDALKEVTVIGKDPIPLEEMDQWLGWAS